MKSKLFTVLVSILFAGHALACGPFWTGPKDFVVYKMGEALINSCDPEEQREKASLEAWCKLAGHGITTDDVAQVMRYNSNRLNKLSAKSPNPFERWLCNQESAYHYIMLAKQCEEVREAMQDPWYYPDSEEWWESPTIQEVESEALKHEPDEMQGRYVLLAVRSMMSQHHYEQCKQYWDSVQHKITCKAVRDLIEPNIVGCRFHLGDSTWALNEFVRLGDVRSAEYCAQKMGLDLFDFASANPNLYIYQCLLDNYLQSLDSEMSNIDYYSYYDEEYRDKLLNRCRQRRDACLKVLQQCRPQNAAMWLYAAAAMSDILGEWKTAVSLCDQALKATGHSSLDERTRVLRFHIEAKHRPLDRGYDAMLERGVRMLAALTSRDLQQFIDLRSFDKYELRAYYDYHEIANYYWKDMLYRIIAGEAVPRLAKAGKTTQALLLCNMAENYIMHLTDADSLMRRYDNGTFELADSLPVIAVKHYRAVVAHPRNSFERWLVKWGYNNADYWNELIGTQCLRDMNYAEAVTYLSKVSSNYQQSMNIWEYIKYNPMHYRQIKVLSRFNYKLNFAMNMLKAQQSMLSKNADERAEGMIRLSIGLENANSYRYVEESEYGTYDYWVHPDCWPLLLYVASCGYYGAGDYYAHKAEKQLELSEKLRKQAFDTFTDHEIAAQWMGECCMFQEVIERYPETKAAYFFGTHCDNLKDYYASIINNSEH